MKTVSKYNSQGYRAEGSVRGSCGHGHRTVSGAAQCMLRDWRSCGNLGGGAYSDRTVVRADGVKLTERELADLDAAIDAYNCR